MTKSNIIVILSVVIALLIGYIFWVGHTPDQHTKDWQQELDSLNTRVEYYNKLTTTLNHKCDSLDLISKRLQHSNDSLNQVKTKLINKYHEIYITIASAGSNQLDSIIRSNW